MFFYAKRYVKVFLSYFLMIYLIKSTFNWGGSFKKAFLFAFSFIAILLLFMLLILNRLKNKNIFDSWDYLSIHLSKCYPEKYNNMIEKIYNNINSYVTMIKKIMTL